MTKHDMKLSDAIKILIHNAREHIQGTGCGISSVPSFEEQQKVEKAIERAEYYLYEWKRES